ncbi:larval cuticle protein F1-like [Sitophilus oryzae]|uniref:Larval cuticle protein F1-like n=1 Tax=Sitophilus oryzae TaxID=7048 RepID=A0A6J2YSR6_SITOR|nr:larval cuticle protein F1-like [Sitophilus oryzae]
MNSFCIAFLFAFLAVASAGILVSPSARIIQGPSSRTTVVGPDGSSISSISPAGQIVQQETLGVVARSAPIVAAPAVVAHTAPIVSAYSAPLLSAYSAPLVSGEHTVIAGPSGTVVSGRSLSAPVVTAW